MYGVVLHAHPVRGESHNQRNTTGEVATVVSDETISVRVTPSLYLIFLLMYLHNIVCQNFGPLVMYISKSRQGFALKLLIWDRFSI